MTDDWRRGFHRSTLALAAGLILESLCACDSLPSTSSSTSVNDGAQNPTQLPAGAGGTSVTAGAGGGPAHAGGGSAALGGAAPSAGRSPADGGSAANTLPPLPSSNSRLSPWQLETEGAPALVLGDRYWDNEQQVFCQFVHAENGELRCYPDVPANHSYSDTYADPECKKDIAWVYDANMVSQPAAVPWARPVLSGAAALPCEPVRYQALRAIAEDNPWYRVGPNGCMKVDDPPVPLQLKMIVDAPENWELGSERDGPKLSDRLHAVQVMMGDGGGFVTRVVDERWQVPCTLTRSATGLECRSPWASAHSGALFADDACLEDLVSSEKCQLPGFALFGGAPFALGAPFTGAFYGHHAVDPTCQLTGRTDDASAGGIRFYRKGAALTASDTLPVPVREGSYGTGRLRLRGLLDETGALLALGATSLAAGSYPYFDSVANEDCQPVWMPDGRVRCVPASVTVAPARFSNLDCSHYAFVCEQGAACDTQKIVLVLPDAHGRLLFNGAYATSTRQDKANIYSAASGSCKLVASSTTISVPTGSLSLDAFPTLQERHADAAL